MAEAIARLRDAGIVVSLFLDPDPRQIDAAAGLGADAVELHTGEYRAGRGRREASGRARQAWSPPASACAAAGMVLHAGHGLTYRNVKPIAAIEGMSELNIGHSIVARAIMVGFEQAVREMKKLVS